MSGTAGVGLPAGGPEASGASGAGDRHDDGDYPAGALPGMPVAMPLAAAGMEQVLF
jgi:hypothetical protein